MRLKDYVPATVEGGLQYRALVPKVDAVGNDVAGVRLPEVAVPRVTHTGWNFYGAPFPDGELCDREGSQLPLAETDVLKAPDDARPSLQALYPQPGVYEAKLQAAAADLVAARLLLPEDAARLTGAAK